MSVCPSTASKSPHKTDLYWVNHHIPRGWTISKNAKFEYELFATKFSTRLKKLTMSSDTMPTCLGIIAYEKKISTNFIKMILGRWRGKLPPGTEEKIIHLKNKPFSLKNCVVVVTRDHRIPLTRKMNKLNTSLSTDCNLLTYSILTIEDNICWSEMERRNFPLK